MTSALVCGGRDYANQERVNQVLARAVQNLGIDTIIEGGAKGADTLAREFALENKLSVIEINADRETHGNRAGPIRNMMMLAQKPDYVIAFPSTGPGTAHMVGAARKGGFVVYEIDKPGLNSDAINGTLANSPTLR